jgi:hypothetical protein
MAWKCSACNWENANMWDKCAKCGYPKMSSGEYQILSKIQNEVRLWKKDVEKYRNSVDSHWEYLQVSSDDIENYGGLNNLGSQGWELVAATSYQEGGGVVIGGVGGEKYIIKIMYIFKRPVQKLPDELLVRYQEFIKKTPSRLLPMLKTLESI